MRTLPNNYAFVDSENIVVRTRGLGWIPDWRKFRRYLRDRHGVTRAYLFMAFLPEREQLHRALQHAGFVLVFKPVMRLRRGGIKCNVDVDVVFRVMAELSAYDKAVIVTGDGDFSLLVRYLLVNGRLETVISPDTGSCSALLKHSAGGRITFMEGLREQLQYGPHPKEASWKRSSR